MKSVALVLFILIFLITAIATVRSIEQAQIVDNEGKDPFSGIKNLLSLILDKLSIIAGKETSVNVTVESPIINVDPNITVLPTPVNVITSFDIPNRGFIILAPKREANTYTAGAFYIALPNGICEITVTMHEPKSYPRVSESDGVNSRNLQSCSILPCEITANIDDEFYMVKLDPFGAEYGYLSIAYNCRS